jgi:hypothetical protein
VGSSLLVFISWFMGSARKSKDPFSVKRIRGAGGSHADLGQFQIRRNACIKDDLSKSSNCMFCLFFPKSFH